MDAERAKGHDARRAPGDPRARGPARRAPGDPRRARRRAGGPGAGAGRARRRPRDVVRRVPPARRGAGAERRDRPKLFGVTSTRSPTIAATARTMPRPRAGRSRCCSSTSCSRSRRRTTRSGRRSTRSWPSSSASRRTTPRSAGGRAGWRTEIDIIRRLPSTPDPCATLQAWRRTGFAPAKAPIPLDVLVNPAARAAEGKLAVAAPADGAARRERGRRAALHRQGHVRRRRGRPALAAPCARSARRPRRAPRARPARAARRRPGAPA